MRVSQSETGQAVMSHYRHPSTNFPRGYLESRPAVDDVCMNQDAAAFGWGPRGEMAPQRTGKFRHSHHYHQQSVAAQFGHGSRRYDAYEDTLRKAKVRGRRQENPKLVCIRFFDDRCNCATCNNLGACFEDLSVTFKGVSFFDASTDMNEEAVRILQIEYLPTVIVFQERRELGRFCGTDTYQLSKFVNDMIHRESRARPN